MLKRLVGVGGAAAMLAMAPAGAQTICQQSANATFCDNRLGGQPIGNTTFYGSGVIRQETGDSSIRGGTALPIPPVGNAALHPCRGSPPSCP